MLFQNEMKEAGTIARKTKAANEGRLSTREPCHLREIKTSRPRLRKRITQSRDWYAISGFRECAAQSRDCTNS